MSLYHLNIRGEDVVLRFTRINDSRRIDSYYTDKTPNLFGIIGAVHCAITLPASLAPAWWAERHHTEYTKHGTGFCHWSDRWESQKGRHKALTEALGSVPHAAEIWNAFLSEEARRAKVVGPASKPRTRKPKARQPGPRETWERIANALEKLAKQKEPALLDRFKEMCLALPLRYQPMETAVTAHDAGIVQTGEGAD